MTAGVGAEVDLLKSCLDAQREHVLGIVESLDDEQLRRPVLPSEWTCLGLVQHLTLDVERFWFQAVLAGDPTVVADLSGDSANAWDVGPEVPAASVLNLYRRDIEQANAVIDSTPMDAAPSWWPTELFGDWRMETARQVILHVITETACHSGHLDAARELIDGRQWLVLTGDKP